MRTLALGLIAALAACNRAAVTTGVSAASTIDLAAFRQLADSLTALPRFRNMHWGVLVVDPGRGETLYSRNAGKLFIPASNQKLLTGAVALEKLGPDYRFTTTVLAGGAISGGVLTGDLRIAGTGDPTFSDRMAGNALRAVSAIADSVAARGITRIRGAITPAGDAFPDAVWGFGWSWDDMDFGYSSGVDELFLNEGVMTVTVIGATQPGAAPTVRVAPVPDFPRLSATVVTGAAGSGSRVRARHDSTDASVLLVTGSVAPADTARVAITYRDQRRAFLESLRHALGIRGVVTEGGVSLGTAEPAPDGSPEPPGYPLFSIRSARLAEVLPHFEKPSQNQIGEILLKTIGRAVSGVGRADSGARVVRDQLIAWGAPRDGFSVRDGSGLSRHNVVSPEVVVTVLDAMRRSPHFGVFHASLPIAGVDGTIGGRMRNTDAQGNVHAKTGTLAMVRSLSGYVTAADGRQLLFSFLSNNWTVPVREVDEVMDALATGLARLRRGSN
ncbi:MAG: D-alanyl-D-alanine carboxypeptidase/D-alanyl-D-alanine endopeptidase [Gemmatimonadota bacterium]